MCRRQSWLHTNGELALNLDVLQQQLVSRQPLHRHDEQAVQVLAIEGAPRRGVHLVVEERREVRGVIAMEVHEVSEGGGVLAVLRCKHTTFSCVRHASLRCV